MFNGLSIYIRKKEKAPKLQDQSRPIQMSAMLTNLPKRAAPEISAPDAKRSRKTTKGYNERHFFSPEHPHLYKHLRAALDHVHPDQFIEQDAQEDEFVGLDACTKSDCLLCDLKSSLVVAYMDNAADICDENGTPFRELPLDNKMFSAE